MALRLISRSLSRLFDPELRTRVRALANYIVLVIYSDPPDRVLVYIRID